MGRDWRRAETRQRSRQVCVRFTPPEHALIVEAADLYHKTVPTLIRDVLFGASDIRIGDEIGENKSDATTGSTLPPRLTEGSPDSTREAIG